MPNQDNQRATDVEINIERNVLSDMSEHERDYCGYELRMRILARLAASEAERDALKAENAAILGDKADEFLKMNTEIRRLQSIIDSGAKKVMTLRALLNHAVIRSEIRGNHMCGVCPECHMIYRLHTSTILETPELPEAKTDGEESFPPEMLDEQITKMCESHVARILAEKLPIVAGDRELAEIITAYACGEFTTDGFEEIIAAFRAERERPLVEMLKRLEIEARGVLAFRDEIGNTNANILAGTCLAASQLLAERGA